VRKKFFIAQKAVRIATGIFAGAILVAGTLAIFYATHETFPYSQNLSSNRNLALNHKVYTSEKDYFADANTGIHAKKKARIEDAYDAALSRNLLGKQDFTDDQFRDFLADLKVPSSSKPKIMSVPQHDKYVKALASLFSVILLKADSLSYQDREEFELKKQIYSLAGDICSSMDGTGSFDGTRTRAMLSNEILGRVYHFQKDTSASSTLKDQLISSCVPKLRIPCDIKFMLRFEFLRVENMIDISSGRAKFDPKSNVFQIPKPLSTANKLKQLVPGVESAWHSRFYEFYALALINAFSEPGMSDGSSLAKADLNHFSNPVNTEYIYYFGANIAELSYTLMEKDQFIYRIKDQQKKDQLIVLTSFK
jgi:hypothetical protein